MAMPNLSEVEPTSRKNRVGQSRRTPFKHELLNKVLGQMAGVAGLPRMRGRLNFLGGMLFVDTCAGDGEPNVSSESSSPEIIAKHADFVRRQGKPSAAIFNEKDDPTFQRLVGNVPGLLGGDLAQTVKHDYQSAGFAACVAAAHSQLRARIGPLRQVACFLHVDPNSVNSVLLSPELQAALPPFTTMIITLGCNVSGIKRMRPEIRDEWPQRMNEFIAAKRPTHDAAIVMLVRDDSQWAYLVTFPRDWKEDIEDKIRKVAGHHWRPGVTIRYLSEGRGFEAEFNRLFLTIREREGRDD